MKFFKKNPLLSSILIIIGIIVVYSVCYFFIIPKLNNQTLERFSQRLTSVALPPNTQQIQQVDEVGQLSGSGDHCDYLSAIMLKTTLPKAELENYYNNNYKGTTKIDFIWTDEMTVTKENRIGNPTGVATLSDWFMNKDQNDQTDVVVYIFDWGKGSSVDPRCGSFGSITQYP